MNARLLLYRLCILVAIAMIIAAIAYRVDAPSQPVANPPIVDSKLELQNEKNSSRLQQQERMARLQSRF